ncbi:MAG: LuxR C-terminal-related transcriptional regulator [Planctomycetota bacterium]
MYSTPATSTPATSPAITNGLDEITPPPLVCVVDQDEAVRRTVADAATRLGMEVEQHATPTDYLASGGLSQRGSRQAVCLVLGVAAADDGAFAVLRDPRLKERQIQVIGVTGEARVADAVAAMEAGALTVFEKPLAVDRLERYLRRAADKGRRVAEAARQFQELASHVAQLSDREHRVLQQIASGALNKVIAGSLEVSVRTVESDRARVVEKLAAQTTGEAVAKYAQYQVLSELCTCTGRVTTSNASVN